MTILIPNSFCFAAIGITKMLKRQSKYSVYIIGTGEESFGVASGSLLVDEYIQSPNLKNESEYASFLTNLLYTRTIDLVFCVLDSDLMILDNIMKYDINITYVNPGRNLINLFQNKLNASKSVSDLGIMVPKIILENAKQQLICRKNVSVGSVGIKKINLYDETGFSEDFFLQEYIDGDEYTVDVFCDKYGVPHLIIPRKRLEIRNGMSFKTQLVNNDIIISKTKLICDHYKIPGLWNVQYIINKNNVYFIELNLRLAGSAIAGIVASFNYIDLYIDHFVRDLPIPNFNELQKNILWDSIVTRYYEETIYHS